MTAFNQQRGQLGSHPPVGSSILTERRRLIEFPQVYDLLPQLDIEPLADRLPTSLDERANIPRRRGAVIDDEVGVRRGDLGTSHLDPLEPCTVDQGTRRPRDPVREQLI